MKYFTIVVALLIAVLAVADAQYRRNYRVVRPLPLPNRGDRYAASLGGAQVGTYGKNRDVVGNRYGGYRASDEVFGESLGNAKVGLYGNDRRGNNWT